MASENMEGYSPDNQIPENYYSNLIRLICTITCFQRWEKFTG